MQTFTTERRVPFSAAQMYALVADVERYPEFLPLCTDLKVTQRTQNPDGDTLVARMSVGYKSIAENFTTRVQLMPDALRIDAKYLDGPFRHLDNHWRFTNVATDTAGRAESLVNFHITYEFKSPMLSLLVGSMFEQAFRKFAEAFENRARAVYGQPAT
ncbi:MAG: type II toxin-antitoxin system RatA family toxin [Hyphomicrobium sp.]|nr:type II toxin-antitoxin system RatA family toxin [Hyphomicrobium sp.]